jgi:hypothetical protein
LIGNLVGSMAVINRIPTKHGGYQSGSFGLVTDGSFIVKSFLLTILSSPRVIRLHSYSEVVSILESISSYIWKSLNMRHGRQEASEAAHSLQTHFLFILGDELSLGQPVESDFGAEHTTQSLLLEFFKPINGRSRRVGLFEIRRRS